MDISAILTNTISTLNQAHTTNTMPRGEIHLAENSSEAGGREASREEIDKTVDSLNKAASSVDNRLSFSYNEKTKRIIIQVVDQTTHEVVNQFPSKEMIRLLENIHDMLGLIIDEKR